MKKMIIDVAKSFRLSFLLVFKNKKELSIPDMTRQQMYRLLWFAICALFVCGITSIILFKEIMFLAVVCLLAITICVYMGVNENDYETGKLQFVYGTCVNKETESSFHKLQSERSRVYLYRFICINDDGSEYSIYIRRTGEMGFKIGATYCLCFRATEDEVFANDNFITHALIQCIDRKSGRE